MPHDTRRTPWMKNTKENRFQYEANEGIRLGFANQWFANYSWIIRINPDVLIRDPTWISQMMNNSTVDGIFVACDEKKIHTDFFAVRPSACAPNAFDTMEHEKNGIANHELTAAKEFHSIVRANRHVWVPGNDPSEGHCRIRGHGSPVLHSHEAVGNDGKGLFSCKHTCEFMPEGKAKDDLCTF